MLETTQASVLASSVISSVNEIQSEREENKNLPSIKSSGNSQGKTSTRKESKEPL
ncbi:hypothetical protein OESDEN_18621 [Oesophagostomum dentatum]|uniref:Uncharacterized protein n=1 Tax=Oesophagostomum dentatum TaxID=61180 RepID=A0A0B1SCU2_OESDE|nr:hypothetical protein OESDEN_18621 [Oesophagostomum dentatum]